VQRALNSLAVLKKMDLQEGNCNVKVNIIQMFWMYKSTVKQQQILKGIPFFAQ
jgi:hypothetical protein